MPPLNCYKLLEVVDGQLIDGLDNYIDFDDRTVQSYGPFNSPSFSAKLFIAVVEPRRPAWAEFLSAPFGDISVP